MEALLHWPWFAALVRDYRLASRIVFMGCQVALIMAAILFLRFRYATAFWVPSRSFWRPPFASVAIFLPFLAWSVYRFSVAVDTLESLMEAAPRSRIPEIIGQLFEQAWASLPYGASLDGVVLFSILALPTPFLEEIVGALVGNALLKRARPLIAIIGVGTVFTAGHVVQYGLGTHLLPLIWAGMTYAAIRINSGNILVPIFCHLTINFFIFAPKWLLAYAHFFVPSGS